MNANNSNVNNLTAPPHSASLLTGNANLKSTVARNQPLLVHQDWIGAAAMLGIGFAPITALALAVIGVGTLPIGTLLLVIPAVIVALVMGVVSPAYGKLMLRGFLMGIIAVTCYDAVRLPFILAGLWSDFVPRIGGWLLSDGQRHVAVGYLWRYLGNGGGMGMAFVAAFSLIRQSLPQNLRLGLDAKRLSQIGVTFGVFIWLCLLATLKISPRGEEMLFVLNLKSFILSLIGHIVYGFTLGRLVTRYQPEKALEGRSETKWLPLFRRRTQTPQPAGSR